MRIYTIKSGREVVEDLPLRRIEQRFLFFYHYRAIESSLVRSIALKMSQHNHSHLMISVYNHNHIYYFVHIYSIKAGREVAEYFSLRIIKRRFRFWYHWRSINTSLVCSTSLNSINHNQYHLMISLLNIIIFIIFWIYILSNQVEKWFNICNYAESSKYFDSAIIGELLVW